MYYIILLLSVWVQADIGDDVLQCCKRNIERNGHIYEDSPYAKGVIPVWYQQLYNYV